MTLKDNQTSSSSPHRKSFWLIGITLIMIGVLAAYYGKPYFFRSKPEATAPHGDKSMKPAIAVIASVAIQQDVPVYLSGLGTVTGLHTVTVRSKIDGELTKLTFKEGQTVRAGDLLAEIDARSYQVQLQQAEGQLARDEALLKNAKIDLARYNTLLTQNSISEQQTMTQAALVKQYQGTVAMDQAQIANAKLQLSYTRLIAPISGRLGLRLIDQGNIIHTNDVNGLVVITQTQPISVVFTVPEDDLPKVTKPLHAGKSLSVEAYDRSGKNQLAQGHLVAVDNQIDVNTGTVKLKSQFDNSDGALFINQFVNVKMRVDILHSVVTVPLDAIQNGATGSFVYVVKDEKTVSVRQVTLGPVIDDRVVIHEGLQADDWVVVDGTDKLREGSAVRLIKSEITTPHHDPGELQLNKPLPKEPHPAS